MTTTKPHIASSTIKYPITSKPEPFISSATPSIRAFLARNNLTPTDLLEVYQFFIYTHPDETYTPVPSQGFCSLTFELSSKFIVQFRTSNYKLDLGVTSLASKIYPKYAPCTKYITSLPRTGLLVYEMPIMPGISLLDYRIENREEATSTFLENLVKTFATFQVEAYQSRTLPPPANYKKTKVAATLHPRLLSLHKNLPTRFRPLTAHLLHNFEEITNLPWVLTHGDLLPGNIMIEKESGKLRGFVDWGESEYLPLGIGFYGVDEILLLPSFGRSDREATFQSDAGRLRDLFWGELERGGVPKELKGRMEMARDLGVLLWFGIAWDGGKIDRVVEEGSDCVEFRKLDGFLFGREKGELENEKWFGNNGKENKDLEVGVLKEHGLTVEAKL